MRIAQVTASALLAIMLAACGAETATTPQAEASPAPETPTTTAPAEEDAATEEAVEFGSSGTYFIDPSHTSLIFQVPHMGLSNYTARFTGVDAKLEFHPEDAALTGLSVTIDAASVATNYTGDYKASHPNSTHDTWDEDISKDPKWMNANEHPTITFTATEITKTGAATADVTGDLTFLGVTQPLTLHVTYNGAIEMRGTEKIGFSATGSLTRSDFGMGAYIPNIGDEVNLIIETEFAKAEE